MAKSRSKPPRVRRTAEEARRVILDAAEKRLREGGPEAIRLQEIARDVGIAHPTILHHFGSRDGLTEALARRAIERLRDDLVAALQGAGQEEEKARGMLERVFSALGDAGHARLLAWRLLSAPPADDDGGETPGILRGLTQAIHDARGRFAREQDLPAPPYEDSVFIVRLVAAALLGDALAGPELAALEDADADPAESQRRFRSWFIELLGEHGGWFADD